MAEQRVQRRLAAILAADVVGYTRLMANDETGTLERLKTVRADVLETKIGLFEGRIFKNTGDGVLAEFDSAVDAVYCAVQIQSALTDHNTDKPENRRIVLRVGISLGDVIIDGEDRFGNGVNVAARMESLADPGTICISANVHEHVANAPDLGFDDLGERSVKNVDRPIRCYRVRSADESIQTSPQMEPVRARDRPGIAVLPFQNMSDDSRQEYFCDGMAEDIITSLSRIRWLFVIARNSSFTFKGKTTDVRRIGRDLSARYLVEGSVRKGGGRIRITAQLIDAETGSHLWADRYDRPLDDVFEVQDEITLSVVGAIEPTLRQFEVHRIKRKRPDSLDAHDLVLLAIPLVNPGMLDETREAIRLLDRALEIEPDYALAHGYAAECHQALYFQAGMNEEIRAAAIRHANAAIQYGRDDALALTLAGFVIGKIAHDIGGARHAFETALALSPSSALTYGYGSVVMAWAGETARALEWAERALRHSPADPNRFAPWAVIAIAQFLEGRFEEAVAAARKTIQANPKFSTAHMLLAAPLAELDRTEEAREAASRLMSFEPDFSIGTKIAALSLSPKVTARYCDALRGIGLPE